MPMGVGGKGGSGVLPSYEIGYREFQPKEVTSRKFCFFWRGEEGREFERKISLKKKVNLRVRKQIKWNYFLPFFLS